MEPVWTALVERGRAAWPTINIAAETFAQYVTDRLEPGEGATEAADLRVEDLYLACGCALGIKEAVRALDERYLSQVGTFLSRIDRSSTFIDDVRQKLREKLLLAHESDGKPKITTYSGRGALSSWMQVAAIRAALNLRRDQKAPKGTTSFDDNDSDEALLLPDPELRLLQRRHRDDFRAAFAQAVTALDVESRQLLRWHFLDGLSLTQIGTLRKVDKSTVSRWLAAARQALFEETQRLLQQQLQVPASDVASLMRVVRDELDDVSLERLLKKSGLRES
jgi:RNA polymerase sigma-70 factor (ECF subfamily)